MKELSTEEKAKRFDEALKMAKECITYIPDEAVNKYMLSMFPELTESEDEKMITKLLKHFDWNAEEYRFTKEDCLEATKWLKHLKDRVQPRPKWSEEDEVGLGDALWAIEQAMTIAKDENDMGNLWYAEKWLKSLKERLKGE